MHTHARINIHTRSQNALRMAVVNVVTSVMLFLGKLSVALLAGLCAFGMSEAKYYNDPNKWVL